MHCVAAAVIVRIPLANQLLLSSGEFIHDITNPAGCGVTVVFFALACLRVPFDASRQQKIGIVNTEVWVPHKDNLSMLVRQAFFQFVEDALGVCSQLPTLNERLSRFYALLAVPRALSGTHKTVDRDVPKGIIIIAAYAKRDQIAISGDSIYLLRSDGTGCCPREG